MKKSVLIFGAGLNQLTLIKAAKELGTTSVVIDPNPAAPGRKMADFFYCVAADDYRETKKIAIKNKVHGIVTGQMEQPLKIMARLAADLGFIFHSPEVVERCRNKYLMKKVFQNNNVASARGKLFRADEVIRSESLNELGFPLILKPSDSYSSRGVFKINTFAELSNFIDRTRAFSSDNSVVLEEFIEGPEYSIEAITYEGKTTIVQYTEKIITPFPNTVEIGHIQPALIGHNQKRQVDSIVKMALKALGINNSASHTELKLTSKGPVIIEIGARLGGDFIPSYLTLASTGVDMDKAAIQVALGQEPDLKKKCSRHSYIKYLELEEGRLVTEIRDYSDISNHPEVVIAHVFVQPDDVIAGLTDSAKRPGCVMVHGGSNKEVRKRGEKLAGLLKSRIVLNGD